MRQARILYSALEVEVSVPAEALGCCEVEVVTGCCDPAAAFCCCGAEAVMVAVDSDEVALELVEPEVDEIVKNLHKFSCISNILTL